MKIKRPVVDYRNFRLGKLNTEEFSHLKLLFFWPLFGLLFMYVERFYRPAGYYPVHCAADDIIPFNELFVFPYMFWFVYLVGIHLYTLLYDIDGFKRLMKFIIITYTTAIAVYFVFPTCQQLRPLHFERNNFLTRFMAGFYDFDTNTNVCPSIHVIGALAVMASIWNIKAFQTAKIRILFAVITFLICISTVFLKQHSLIDVIAALPVCAVAYIICYGHKKRAPQNKAERQMAGL